MSERIPQSSAIRLAFKAFLSTDGGTEATGKTIAVTISKNGAAFGNPNAGATNATEVANGWYYVDLAAADTNTLGPLLVRGAGAGIDDVGLSPRVVSANNAGFAGVPDIAAGANGGLPTGDAAGKVALQADQAVNTTKVNGTAQTAKDLGASATQTGDAFARIGLAGVGLTALGDARIGHLDADISTRSTFAGGAVASVTADVGITQAAADKVWGSAARSLTTFGSLVADVTAAVWGAATRVLTAGTNIVLAKGVGLTGLNDLDAAGVRTAAGLALANLDTQLAAIAGKTGNLPAAPADEALIIAATDAIMTRLGAPAGASVSADVAAVKSDTAAIPSAATIAATLLAEPVEGTITFLGAMRLKLAALVGKASGMASTTAHFRDVADTKDRIVATVDAVGNRSAVTLDPT